MAGGYHPCRVTLRALIATVSGVALAADPTDAQLRYACRDIIKQSLHDPRGADLSTWTEGRTSKNNDGTFTVRFPARAAVGGGGMRLVTFECVLRVDGADTFTATSVRAIPRSGL
jgi:hypothetical protein